MNRKYTYILLVILVTAGLYFAEKYVDRNNESYPNPEETSLKDPSGAEFGDAYYPSSTTGSIVDHTYFRLSYSEAHEQAEWVAYELKLEHLSDNDFDRPYFVEDPKVRSSSADWRNYKKSGYDRGHLCPAGDRRFSYDAYNETFLTSNISPQNHEFNSGIWNRLEQKVRRWARQHQGVFVITGGVLEKGLPYIGEERVSVPKYFYKIIVDASGAQPRAIAFLIPNQTSSQSYFDFVVSIDAVEEKTGIDFLAGLPEALESPLESTVEVDFWKRR